MVFKPRNLSRLVFVVGRWSSSSWYPVAATTGASTAPGSGTLARVCTVNHYRYIRLHDAEQPGSTRGRASERLRPVHVRSAESPGRYRRRPVAPPARCETVCINTVHTAELFTIPLAPHFSNSLEERCNAFNSQTGVGLGPSINMKNSSDHSTPLWVNHSISQTGVGLGPYKHEK